MTRSRCRCRPPTACARHGTTSNWRCADPRSPRPTPCSGSAGTTRTPSTCATRSPGYVTWSAAPTWLPTRSPSSPPSRRRPGTPWSSSCGPTRRYGRATLSRRTASDRWPADSPRPWDARGASSTSRTSTCGPPTSHGCWQPPCAAARSCTSSSSCRATPTWTAAGRFRPTRWAGCRPSGCAARRQRTVGRGTRRRVTAVNPPTRRPRRRRPPLRPRPAPRAGARAPRSRARRGR